MCDSIADADMAGMRYMYEYCVDDMCQRFISPLANRSCHVSVMQVLKHIFCMDGAKGPLEPWVTDALSRFLHCVILATTM
jgi:hypothetical protein